MQSDAGNRLRIGKTMCAVALGVQLAGDTSYFGEVVKSLIKER